MNRQITIYCQSCMKEIEPGQEAVCISYGYIAKSGRFYCRKGIDTFHAGCAIAIREKEVK